jgi:hypothetical protein
LSNRESAEGWPKIHRSARVLSGFKKTAQDFFVLFSADGLGDFWRIGEAPKDAGVIA